MQSCCQIKGEVHIVFLQVRAWEIVSELKRRISGTKVIVSDYVNTVNFTAEKLGDLIADMQSTNADIIKLVVDVDYITHVAPIFHMLTHCQVILRSFFLFQN